MQLDWWTHPLYVFISFSLCEGCIKLFTCIQKHRSARFPYIVYAVLFILSYNYQPLDFMCSYHFVQYILFRIAGFFWILYTSLISTGYWIYIHTFCYLPLTRNCFCMHMNSQLSEMVVQCLRTSLSFRTSWVSASQTFTLGWE